MELIINHALLSSLIGLVRATDGNEDLVTEYTNELIIKALKTNDIYLIKAIEDEKRRIVPDCYLCQTPCGKTSNYNVKLIFNEDDKIKTLKLKIINKLSEINNLSLIYKSLFFLGLADELELNYILEEIEKSL